MLLSALVCAGAFSWYAFFNPDQHPCYYFDGKAVKRINYDRILTPEEQDEAVNVTFQFCTWFASGIILCALVVLYGIMGFVFQCTKNVNHAKFANCFLILGYIFTMAWLVYGTVIRYQKPGKTCSGDYLSQEDIVDFSEDLSFSYNPYLLRSG